MARYEALFKTMITRPSVAHAARDVCLFKIKPNKTRYQFVANETKVPWWWIAIVHHMESGSNFTTHLHNGDPLSARTVHRPEGRPIEGNPPFAWEVSAKDALTQHEAVAKQKTWKLENALWLFEKFNGMGYEMHGVNSAYVWSGCQHYVKGRYVPDGEWNAESVSEQIGAAIILKELVNMGEVVMTDIISVPTTPAPIIVQPSAVTIPLLESALKFLQGPIGAIIMSQAIDPNSLLNTLAHQNFWLGLAVTVIGGALQHLKTDSSNKNTLSALGFTSSPQ
jgi:lysozyme family protein